LLKKAIICGFLLIFAFGLVEKVTSFTSAEVYNEASITIVPSEDALIALPGICDLGEVTQGEEITKNIRITNNLSRSIEVWVVNNDRVALKIP